MMVSGPGAQDMLSHESPSPQPLVHLVGHFRCHRDSAGQNTNPTLLFTRVVYLRGTSCGNSGTRPTERQRMLAMTGAQEKRARV
jgi:hypothetical protein